jgi:hypothetical protein
MASGSRGRHKARRGFQSPSNERTEETIELGVAACESAAGELKRRTQQGSEPRQKFSRMFSVNTTGSPRLKSAKKFTK